MTLDAITRPDIKPAFAERNLPVALATDENYLPYAAVTINSLVVNTKGSNLDVLILHAGISESARAGFLERVQKVERLSVRFVDIGDAVEDTVARSFVQKNYISVTTLFRLFIPKVFTAYERLVYLDVDLVVCQDISELYAADLAGCLLGAVRDYGAKNYARSRPKYREFAEKYGFSEWDGYVNAGVLLMDLVALRSADLLDRILPIAVEATGFCSDQDALNFLCKGRIRYLDPKWNMLTLPASYERQLKAAGGQQGIVHFASGKKPWKRLSHLCAHLWWSFVEDTDFARAQWRKIFAVGSEAVTCGEGIAVTVLVPVYNAEKYLFEALASLAVQPLRNIEIVCVDDGSTDGSRAIVQTLQKFDSRIKLLSQRRQGPGVARNAALDVATGEYVYFLDADDRIAPGDAFVRACEQARRDRLDMLLAASSTLSEDGKILRADAGLYRDPLPQEPVFSPDSLGAALFLCAPLGPCGKLYRRSFLAENRLRFPALPRSEAVPTVGLSLALSSRIGVCQQPLYERRIGVASSLESTKDETPLVFFEAEQMLRDSLKERNLWNRFKAAVYSAFVCNLVYNLRAVRSYSSFRAIVAKYRQEHRHWICWEEVVLAERFADKVQLVKDIMEDMDEDDQIALFVNLREQAAQNAPEVVCTIVELREANARRVKQIVTLREANAKRVKQITTLREASAQQAKQIATLREASAQQAKQIATLREANAKQAKQTAVFKRKLAGCQKEISDLQRSHAYRTGMALTWPARKAWGGVKCLRENGVKYTARHALGGALRIFGFKVKW